MKWLIDWGGTERGLRSDTFRWLCLAVKPAPAASNRFNHFILNYQVDLVSDLDQQASEPISFSLQRFYQLNNLLDPIIGAEM
jgi:hypothetical protein